MLTVDQLKAMPPGTMFAQGVAIDKSDGLFMANTGKELRWVAVRGGIADWAIYCHFTDRDILWIRQNGDKVYEAGNIKKLVPCDDEALATYRR